MFSLEPELQQLRDERAPALIARERRDVVSLYAELRFLTWGGVMLLITGLGMFVAKHREEIGPIAIVLIIAAAAAVCYAYAFARRGRSALVDDYILLLGALLASTDVAYIEHEFNQRWLLPLVLFHAATAYLFESRLILAVAIGALATYFGIERRPELLWHDSVENARRAFVCSGIVFAWRFADAWLRAKTAFTRVFDHFAANLAFWGAISLFDHSETRLTGCLLAILFAIASAFFGLRKREELFVIYAWVYGMIAIDVLVIDRWVKHEKLVMFYFTLSTIAAIIGMIVTLARLRRAAS